MTLSCTAQEVLSSAVQALMLNHWFACCLMVATSFAVSPLSSWLATHGYCMPEELDDSGFAPDDTAYSCVGPGLLYLKVWAWSMGLIFHNSIPMRPEMGPFEPYYSEDNHYRLAFTPSEEVRARAFSLCPTHAKEREPRSSHSLLMTAEPTPGSHRSYHLCSPRVRCCCWRSS